MHFNYHQSVSVLPCSNILYFLLRAAQRAIVALEQVASMEEAHKDVGEQMGLALNQLAEEEQKRKVVEY